MVKTEMKKIENTIKRQKYFSRRRQGLMKKAKELSILCDAEVGVIVFSSTGELFEFSSSRMEQILSRYNRSSDSSEVPSIENVTEVEKQREIDALKAEATSLRKNIQCMMGKDLEGMSYSELQQLELQLDESIYSINKKKGQGRLMELIEKSKLQEQKALLENETLREQIEELRRRGSTLPHENTDINLSLCLGLPTGDIHQKREVPKLDGRSNCWSAK